MRLSFKIAVTTLSATAYAVLTIVLGSFGYAWIQVRVSEALTPLPFLLGLPSVVGLTLGCILANIFSPIGLPDIVFGPMMTLLAAFLSWRFNFKRKIVACIYPVLINAIGVSSYVSLFYGTPYPVTVIAIAVGEFIAAVMIGYPMLTAIERVTKHESMANKPSRRYERTSMNPKSGVISSLTILELYTSIHYVSSRRRFVSSKATRMMFLFALTLPVLWLVRLERQLRSLQL